MDGMGNGTNFSCEWVRIHIKSLIHLSHEKKTAALLSMKYRMVNRDPINGLFIIPI